MINSVDPDETPRNAASHLGLHCLPRPASPNTYDKYGMLYTHLSNGDISCRLKLASQVFKSFENGGCLHTSTLLQLAISVCVCDIALMCHSFYSLFIFATAGASVVMRPSYVFAYPTYSTAMVKLVCSATF